MKIQSRITILLAGITNQVYAGVGTTNMQPTANIVKTCSISATDANFGVYPGYWPQPDTYSGSYTLTFNY